MRLEYHPAASQDIVEAGAYYAEQRPSLGVEFLDDLNVGIAAILASPERWAVWRGQRRRYTLDRFPYTIVYRVIQPDVIRILVVRHHSRSPGYGMRRT